MPIRNAIRQSSIPDLDDLVGWEIRVAQLEGELERAKIMAAHIKKKQPLRDINPNDALTNPTQEKDDAS